MSPKSKGPQFVRFFGPVLDALQVLGGSGSPTEVADKIAEMLQIPAKQQEELTSSGQQRYLNRVQWARFYLTKAGYISSSERGVWALTDKGRNKSLEQEESLRVFQEIHKRFDEERRLARLSKPDGKEESESPEEAEAETSQSYREQLLNTVSSCPMPALSGTILMPTKRSS